MNLPFLLVANELEAALNAAALIEAAHHIQYVAAITERDKLGDIFKRRLEQFKSKEAA